MDLMSIRRGMLMGQKSGELYPVGTNILGFYQVYGTEEKNARLSLITGEIVYSSSASSSASPVYIPISNGYTYVKTKRFYAIAYYDKNKSFISGTSQYNNTTDDVIISGIPTNAKYMRVSFVYTARPTMTRSA